MQSQADSLQKGESPLASKPDKICWEEDREDGRREATHKNGAGFESSCSLIILGGTTMMTRSRCLAFDH